MCARNRKKCYKHFNRSHQKKWTKFTLKRNAMKTRIETANTELQANRFFSIPKVRNKTKHFNNYLENTMDVNVRKNETKNEHSY